MKIEKLKLEEKKRGRTRIKNIDDILRLLFKRTTNINVLEFFVFRIFFEQKKYQNIESWYDCARKKMCAQPFQGLHMYILLRKPVIICVSWFFYFCSR